MKTISIPDTYELLQQETITDLNSEGLLLRHKKTHARVALLMNDDENKVFYVGFRTPPKDSTGVTHIIEHTVLCGSESFPIKDPFMELVKGSLNTFLNAMTYPDKTVYPVASCNDTDFKNLMHVYLDAVFHPLIYGDDKIFKQEGWHYELHDKEDALQVNGVVYNEMKGSMSSPDTVLNYEMRASLFPDTAYRHLSGGDPEVISDLTYDEYLDYHRTYYHPTNSYIYLYGNVDMTERLRWLDEAYLSHFDLLTSDTLPPLQSAFSAPKEDLVKTYPAMEQAPLTKNTYLSYNICTDTNLDKELYIALDVLDYALCDAPGAALKQALIDAGIGTDVYSAGSSGIRQSCFSIVAKGTDEDSREDFIRIIRDTLQKIVREGFDEKALYAGLNQNEFQYREADFGRYPKGLMYGLQMLDSWIYDDDQPFLHVNAGATYNALKKKVKEGYFESLLTKWFLDNPHRTVLALVPERGLTQKREALLRKKLDEIKASMTPEEIEIIIRETKELEEWQKTPNAEEDLLKIPMLKRADLKKEAEPFVNEERVAGDARILYHDIPTNGVCYVSLIFDMEHVPGELYPYAGILKTMLGMVDTATHGYADLSNEINIRTGGFTGSVSTYTNVMDDTRYIRTFEISFKVLSDHIKDGFDLAKEMLLTSLFTDEKRIREVVSEMHSRMQEDLVYGAHSAAVLRALSHLSETAKIGDTVNGLTAFRLVEDIDADDIIGMRKRAKMSKALTKLTKVLFRRENLLIDFTAPEKDYDAFAKEAKAFADALFTESVTEGYFNAEVTKTNEAFSTAGQVQYVCRAGNYRKEHLPYTGRLRILKSVLANDYLWQNIRITGGAYGCMCGFARNGDSYFVSYRDPHLKRTIDVFSEAAAYVRDFTADERAMTQYLIGAISELDMPKTPSAKGAYGLGCYLTGLTMEMMQKDRDEMLEITQDEVRLLAPYVDALMQAEVLCVVGTEEKIDTYRDLFDHAEPLIMQEAKEEEALA